MINFIGFCVDPLFMFFFFSRILNDMATEMIADFNFIFYFSDWFCRQMIIVTNTKELKQFQQIKQIAVHFD